MPPARSRVVARSRNLLLNALPAKDYEDIRPLLDLVTLEAKRVLHNPGEPSRHVYFPRGGFLSTAIVLENGSMVEVATIGREGMAGLTARGPGRGATTNTLVVMQGHDESAYRMRLDDFRREMDRCSTFMDLVNNYTEVFLAVVMQATGCNAAHNVEQRRASATACRPTCCGARSRADRGHGEPNKNQPPTLRRSYSATRIRAAICEFAQVFARSPDMRRRRTTRPDTFCEESGTPTGRPDVEA
ncbi:MAG: Crp/Fnr family transcriptional regulator [Acidobacteria bacterium]|nr:Crp/Fnr family transcriptional regulator [Acidobacteriota bacterium]